MQYMTRLFDEKKVVGLVPRQSLTMEQQNDDNAYVPFSDKTYALLFNSGLFTVTGASLYGLCLHFESNNPSKYSPVFDPATPHTFHPFRAWKCVCWSHDSTLGSLHQRLDLTKHFNASGTSFMPLPEGLYPQPCNFFHQHPSSDLYTPQCLSQFDSRLPVKADFRYIFGADGDVAEQRKRREHRLPRAYQDESKFSNSTICDLVASGLGTSIQMATANPRFTIPYYCPDFNIPRGGSVQLLLPVSLSSRNGRWYPHVIVALEYVPPQDGEGFGHYSAKSIVGLGGARFYSRVVQKLDQQWISISANRSSRPSNRNSSSVSNRTRNKQEVCSYFLRGACQFGDSCSFLHNVSRGGSGGSGGRSSTSRSVPYDLSLQGKGLLKGPSGPSGPSSFRNNNNSNNFNNNNSNSFQYRGGGGGGGGGGRAGGYNRGGGRTGGREAW